jgi:hypothetical protein
LFIGLYNNFFIVYQGEKVGKTPKMSANTTIGIVDHLFHIVHVIVGCILIERIVGNVTWRPSAYRRGIISAPLDIHPGLGHIVDAFDFALKLFAKRLTFSDRLPQLFTFGIIAVVIDSRQRVSRCVE